MYYHYYIKPQVLPFSCMYYLSPSFRKDCDNFRLFYNLKRLCSSFVYHGMWGKDYGTASYRGKGPLDYGKHQAMIRVMIRQMYLEVFPHGVWASPTPCRKMPANILTETSGLFLPSKTMTHIFAHGSTRLSSRKPDAKLG
jgi:hypothetical protein